MPVINPVILVVGEDGVTIVGVLGPLTIVHSPVPEVGATAFIDTEDEPQTPLGVVPPSAVEGGGPETKREMSSLTEQAPFETVYLKTYTPETIPVTVVV